MEIIAAYFQVIKNIVVLIVLLMCSTIQNKNHSQNMVTKSNNFVLKNQHEYKIHK
jgi:hypothetical protein